VTLNVLSAEDFSILQIADTDADPPSPLLRSVIRRASGRIIPSFAGFERASAAQQ
jgi:hypothetical protein